MVSLVPPPPIPPFYTPATMTSPAKGHDSNFALEKYLLLQEQHEELSHHLEQIRPRQLSASSISTHSSSTWSCCSSSSPSSSFVRPQARPSEHRPSEHRPSEHRPPRARARCSASAEPLDTIVDEETLCEISAEERRLLDVNESIKRALTELLNSDAVCGDHSMLLWAQTRLMETEKELRSGRRRRSSPGTE